jgi:hypothetical protein
MASSNRKSKFLPPHREGLLEAERRPGEKKLNVAWKGILVQPLILLSGEEKQMDLRLKLKTMFTLEFSIC